jgi:hypothetical protein
MLSQKMRRMGKLRMENSSIGSDFGLRIAQFIDQQARSGCAIVLFGEKQGCVLAWDWL